MEILVTEETLHSVFDQYNNVIDASIKKTVCDKVRIYNYISYLIYKYSLTLLYIILLYYIPVGVE